MALQWSHDHLAYENCRKNILFLDKVTVETALSGILVKKYYSAQKLSFDEWVDVLENQIPKIKEFQDCMAMYGEPLCPYPRWAEFIWECAKEVRLCDNDGCRPYLDPDGEVKGSFDRLPPAVTAECLFDALFDALIDAQHDVFGQRRNVRIRVHQWQDRAYNVFFYEPQQHPPGHLKTPQEIILDWHPVAEDEQNDGLNVAIGGVFAETTVYEFNKDDLREIAGELRHQRQ
jgi:hypothetical protein